MLLAVLVSGLVFPPTGRAQRIGNPVLPRVADAGVLRYNGEYYIGGVFTNGSFYRSADLVNWEGPFHVFSMDNDWTSGASAHDSQIHASDIHYLNGVFHHYWSVNYWGKDRHVVHIGHATARHVLGPYREPVKETWLDNRIDPHLFRDLDGKLYLYLVKFTDGNAIWVRPMKDPGTFSDEPRFLFSSLPGTWETRDNRVAEGPWVIHYRGQYYLMYNANHTSTSWGNYALGVAQAGGPMDFTQSAKYPHPVLESNQVRLEDDHPDLLRQDTALPFAFTMENPGGNWAQPDFDDSAWKTGGPGFGSARIENSTTRSVNTWWKTDTLWIRKSFIVKKDGLGKLSLRIHHDGPTRVLLNGMPIYSGDARAYRHWNLDARSRALLKDGKNLLAIESQAGPRSAFLDVSLFDMQGTEADDILFSPGQPNMVRGPNGFEWWLVYMANKNAEPRGQYINRIHFFDKKLTVDGITADRTPGHHPPPAAPTFGDLFHSSPGRKGEDPVRKKWRIHAGSWVIGKNELVQTSATRAAAFPRTDPGRHYLFETGLRMDTAATDAAAGIYAWWKDEKNWLKIAFSGEGRKWSRILCRQGETTTVSHSLPEDFDPEVYHTLKVYKNEAHFRVLLDGIPIPGEAVIEVPDLRGPGLPGLFTDGSQAAFDGVVYTIGWDEFDDQITGWEGEAPWPVSESGIGPGNSVMGKESESDAVFKGDFLENYEFSLQVSGGAAKAGVYAVYVDRDNYLKAIFCPEDRRLIISGRKNAQALDTQRIPLVIDFPVYADMRHSDFIEKRFTLDAPAWISGLRLNRTPHGEPDTVLENIFDRIDLYYEQEGAWHALENFRNGPLSHTYIDQILFEPVKTTALKLVNKHPEDHRFYAYRLLVNELYRESNNLRVIRLSDQILFFVNGREVFRMAADFPPSQVGLIASDEQVRFNGIMRFALHP